MKPPPFEYHDPNDVEEALALMAEHGEDAKVLAGGQSLVPLMNFRLARPERLVDINRLATLSYIRRRDGVLTIGALTRQSSLEQSPLVSRDWPLLIQATRCVAHAQIRNRGTVGGSVAHADPSAELPAAFVALNARFRLCSSQGMRTVDARDFFLAPLTTSLRPNELLVEIEVPAQPIRTGHSFTEFARRHGDFALGGAAVVLTLDRSGVCEAAAITLLAAAPTPVCATEAEATLRGTRIGEDGAAAAARDAVAGISPSGDIHGSSRYRRNLIEALVRTSIREAARQAEEATHAQD